jgi:hypothetical protein
MKTRTIGILAGLTILGIVVAILVNRESASHLPNSGELLFPNLLPVVNEVNVVNVETHDQAVTLVRGEKTWGVKEKDGYPADLEKVKQTIIGLAEMRILEPKTKNPELYDRLGLQDKDQEGALSTFVTLKTPNNPEAAKVIVGNQRPAKGNPRLSDIYVRKAEDPQTWLVNGNLPLEKMAGEWLDKEIISLMTKRVHRVLVTHPEGDTLVLSKESPKDLDFRLDSIPPGFKVASQFNTNNVVGSLVQLSLEDVKKEEEDKIRSNSGVSAVLETFDGLRLKVQTAKKDDKIFGKFFAEFDPDLVRPVDGGLSPDQKEKNSTPDSQDKSGEKMNEKDQSTEKSKPSPKEESVLKKPEEVQKEVKELNQRVEGWVYELPKFKVENFSKHKKDLMAKSS